MNARKYVQDRLERYLDKVKRCKAEAARLAAERAAIARRHGLSRRVLMAGMAACIGVAALMPGAKAAFDLDIVDVKRYGARFDGVTDDTAAIQAAINTGKTVLFPPGTGMVSSQILTQTPNQIIMGSGLSNQTIIKATSGFTSGTIFNTNVTSVGPQLMDFWITCTTAGNLTGITFQGCPRFKLVRMRVTRCQIGLDMRKNSGGANMTDCEFWNTSDDIVIDGSLDCVFISGHRSWPFDDPSGLYYNHVGIQSGRCDGLMISNSMFICNNQLDLFTSAGFPSGTSPGSTFAQVNNTDFDSLNGLIISGGWAFVTGCTFSGSSGVLGGLTIVSNITQTGGVVSLSSCFFTNAVSTIIGCNAGTLQIEGCNFAGAGNGNPFVNFGGAASILLCNNNNFVRSSGVGGNYMITVGSGRATITNNRCPIDGTGNFILVSSDNWNRVVYNATGSWTNSFPTPTVGIYTPN
jgi:hypothetical protein